MQLALVCPFPALIDQLYGALKHSLCGRGGWNHNTGLWWFISGNTKEGMTCAEACFVMPGLVAAGVAEVRHSEAFPPNANYTILLGKGEIGRAHV